MIVKTGRFGQLEVTEGEVIQIPQGVLGFPDLKNYCLVDPGDETLILWLQSIDEAGVAFPVLEPKIFKPDYAARLSAVELKELRLENVNQSAVFSVLTIPEDVTQMTANLKAPIIVNLKEQVGKQVVLQENDFSIRHLMFKELRSHLMTIQAQRAARASEVAETSAGGDPQVGVVAIRNIPPSLTVRSLSVT